MTRLALLWHMHQPYYEDLATGEHILPWVRLHAIKDYWGMVALAAEFPGVRLTFNLVPSLLVQIQAFAEERAGDRHLELGLKPAEELDATERAWLVANGFHAPVDRMIRTHPRYAELYDRRQSPRSFTAQDLRDLQVWHKLAWMDPDRLTGDARLARLVVKGRGYAEADKQLLRVVELELLRAVIPAYREAARRGQIELSTSPFYHPILPLLCDSDVHLRAHPHSALPRRQFAYPSDAVDQIRRARALHAELFDYPPLGVWPSEGSLSDEVVGLLAAEGCRWTATDEELLARTLRLAVTADSLYRPYEVGRTGRTVRCLFRDHGLSDLIGFAYQSWDAETAADDFVGKVRAAGERFARGAKGGSAGTGSEVPTVTVILDGENAWEHYAGGGRPFLRALYRRLEAARDIETVTMAEAAAGPARRLETMFPGSWINGDFYIWAGHADDHRAWWQLAEARRAFDLAGRLAPAKRERAWQEIQIAEGSDWFWWYGDDHSSDHDPEFDDLFRRHLRNVYRALGLAAPDDLQVSNITTDAAAAGPVGVEGFVSPTLDGRVTSYVEWAAAAVVPIGAGGGTMHRVAGRLVQALAIGADAATLYLRLDGSELVRGLAAGELGLVVRSEEPPRTIRFPEPDADPGEARADSSQPPASVPSRIAWSAIVEIAIPFSALAVQPGHRLRLAVRINDAAGQALEQHPAARAFELEVPAPDLPAVRWNV